MTGDGWGDGQPADVVEQGGGRRFPSLNRRPPRYAALLLAVGVVIGFGAGYLAGHRQAPRSASPPQPTVNVPAPPPSIFAANPVIVPVSPGLVPASQGLVPGGPVVAQTSSTCFAPAGRDLQLGVQVTNLGPAGVSLGQIQAVLPLGGLRMISQQWAPCGAAPARHDSVVLAPGDSAWFSVTFDVLERCPGALPVQFTVASAWRGLHQIIRLPGFADLSHVRYPGCPAP